jgi:hypothetical protein
MRQYFKSAVSISVLSAIACFASVKPASAETPGLKGSYVGAGVLLPHVQGRFPVGDSLSVRPSLGSCGLGAAVTVDWAVANNTNIYIGPSIDTDCGFYLIGKLGVETALSKSLVLYGDVGTPSVVNVGLGLRF